MANSIYHRRKRNRPLAEINVVPYIDVMLVLLVIFMITAPLLTQGVKVNLPQTNASALSAKDETPLIVSIDSLGHYYLNANKYPNQPLKAETLQIQIAANLQLAKQQHRPLPVYVKADQSVNYGKVMQLMTLLQQAGAAQVGLITRAPRYARMK